MMPHFNFNLDSFMASNVKYLFMCLLFFHLSSLKYLDGIENFMCILFIRDKYETYRDRLVEFTI